MERNDSQTNIFLKTKTRRGYFKPPNTTNTIIKGNCGAYCVSAWSDIITQGLTTTFEVAWFRGFALQLGVTTTQASRDVSWGWWDMYTRGLFDLKASVTLTWGERGKGKETSEKEKEQEGAVELSGFTVRVSMLNSNQVLMWTHLCSGLTRRDTRTHAHTTVHNRWSARHNQHPTTITNHYQWPCNHCSSAPASQMMDEWWCHQDVIVWLANDRKFAEQRSRPSGVCPCLQTDLLGGVLQSKWHYGKWFEPTCP